VFVGLRPRRGFGICARVGGGGKKGFKAKDKVRLYIL